MENHVENVENIVQRHAWMHKQSAPAPQARGRERQRLRLKGALGAENSAGQPGAVLFGSFLMAASISYPHERGGMLHGPIFT